jgi:hypothetical protein
VSGPTRPTCGTCPYLDRVDGSPGDAPAARDRGGVAPEDVELADERQSVYRCRRHAPARILADLRVSGPDPAPAGHAVWPEVAPGDWCGEHPLFGSYIIARQEQAAEPPQPGERAPAPADRP